MGGSGSAGRRSDPGTTSQALGLVADAVGAAVAGLAARLESPTREPPEAPGPTEAAATPTAASPPPGPAPASPGPAPSVATRLVSAVVARVNMNALLDRIDVQRVVNRVDVNAVVEQVNIDAVLTRVEPNRILDRVDIDEQVRRVDVGAVAREAIDGVDLPAVVRESTASLGGDTIRAARIQAMRTDVGVAGLIDRALGRERPRPPLTSAGGSSMSRAGIASRLLATAIDVLMVLLIGASLLFAVAAFRLLWGGDFDVVTGSEIQNRSVAVLVLFAYLGYGWGLNGRTLGQILLGLRVVRADGSDVSFSRGFVRSLLYLVLPIGLAWALFSRRSASLQDLWLRTVVVHDWGHVPTEEPPTGRLAARPA